MINPKHVIYLLGFFVVLVVTAFFGENLIGIAQLAASFIGDNVQAFIATFTGGGV